MNNQKTLFAILVCLYFSQGLPSGLLAHTLPALMRSYGVSHEWIGAIKLLALPWFFKFLWAPFIDQRWQRKYWILVFQTIAIGLLWLLSFFEPETLFSIYLVPFLALLFLLNTCSASQDIASDGIAIRHLPKASLGMANSIQIGAYKIGLIAGGTALLVTLDTMGWQSSMQIFACLLTLVLLPVMLFKDTTANAESAKNRSTKLAFMAIFNGFIREKNMLFWLLIVITYKIADSLGSGMLKPMLVDTGFSLKDIGYLTSISSLIGIAGAIIGGWLFTKIALRQALFCCGLLQACSIGLLALIPVLAHIPAWIYVLTLFEQLTDGLSTVILFAAMMMHCRKGFEGTDYTLQNSIHLIGAGTASIASGFIVSSTGYTALYIVAFAAGLLSLALILAYPARPGQGMAN